MTSQPANNGSPMPSVLDREIRSERDDAFGHRHFAGALRSLLEFEGNEPPFSVGLLGPWGTGKSTIKELYLAGLRDDPTKTGGRTRRERIHAITFNAWRYGGEDIKRALLRHAFLALGGDEEELRRELYEQVQKSVGTPKGIWEWTKEALLQNLASVALFLVLLVAVMTAAWAYVALTDLTDQLGLSILGPVALVAAVVLVKYVVDIRIKSPAFFTPTTNIQFPSTSVEEYELLLLQQLRRFKESRQGRFCERLIVFVDDLDRLSAAEMVAGLDAVRTFLELPAKELPVGLGVIFVISCDEDRVAEALARGRGRLGGTDLPGSVFTRPDARRYLDRLFQFRLEIPRFPKRDMRRFAHRKLGQMVGLIESLESRGAQIQDVIDRLIHVGVQNPRNALQILNAFAQSWWIATERERAGVGSDQPGVLHLGAVTEEPLSLAALCVLRVDFPDFYNRLQERSELIQEFTSVAFGTADPAALPVRAEQLLSEFLKADKDGKLLREVKDEHRPLRQYLASLQGLRWPKRMQPLLLLSEDAITRRYGPRAAELHVAFVSGDTDGVLEVFGRHLDDKPLAVEDVRLLEDLSETVSQDTESRRINAARVLADLAPRIPTEHARGLMTPLARQLIELKQVRMIVGPSRAEAVLQYTGPNDQRDVASGYCEDLLREEPIDYRLPTGETPNLQEATELVKAGCDLALAVRAAHGLPRGADELLLSWLTTRHVRLGKDVTSLPFADLDNRVDTYESSLLLDLGERYSDLAIAEFEAGSTSAPSESEVLRRIESVLNELAGRGEESRNDLWGQLVRLVKVRNSAAVSVAWTNAARHADTATAEAGSHFVAAMSRRLQQELEDEEEEWSLDWEPAAQQLLDLVAQWNEQLEADAIDSFSKLVMGSAEIEDTASFAASGFWLLKSHHAEALEPILDEWSSAPIGTLPWPAREIVAKEVEDTVTDAQRATLVKQLDSVTTTDNVDPDVASDYVRFVRTVPQSAWDSEPLRGHVDGLFTRLEAMFQNQNDFLRKLFPAGKVLLHCAPTGRAGAMLRKLFEQAAGVPAVYPFLHAEMIGAWPQQDERLGNYGPEQIFDRAGQFMEQHPSIEGTGDVFRSAGDLLRRKLVPETKAPDLARSAVKVWPHEPDAVADYVDDIAPHASPDDIAALVKESQNAVDASGVDVEKMMSKLSMAKDAAENGQITQRILQDSPSTVNDVPDGGLSMWLDGVGDRRAEILGSLLRADELNDSQTERLFRQASRRASELGLPFFLEVVPSLLSKASRPSTKRAVLDSLDDVSTLATSLEEKSKLSEALISGLPHLAAMEQATVARSIRGLGGQASLEKASTSLEALEDEGLEIVVKEFPESRQLKKVLKERQQSHAEE